MEKYACINIETPHILHRKQNKQHKKIQQLYHMKNINSTTAYKIHLQMAEKVHPIQCAGILFSHTKMNGGTQKNSNKQT